MMNESSDMASLIDRVTQLERRTERLEKELAMDLIPELAAENFSPDIKTDHQAEVPQSPEELAQKSSRPAPFLSGSSLESTYVSTVASEPADEESSTPQLAPVLMVAANQSGAANNESAQSTKAKSGQSLESRIGLYWLSKLGIGFLVVGVALLIMYSWENFGPAAKVATGYIVASILLAVGEYLERRDNIPWYARLLEGGSWAMAYFTTYAMHHVASVRLIADPLTDLILLMGVAGIAISHALNKRSEVMAIFAVTLGFVTLCLSHVTGFSACASALLVAVATLLSTRKNWFTLYVYSVLASYGAILLSGNLQATGPEGLRRNFEMAGLLLTPSLIGFSLVPGLARNVERSCVSLIEVGAVVNLCAYCLLFFPSAYLYLHTGAAVYNLEIAAWMFVAAYLANRRGLRHIARVTSLLALTVGSLYYQGSEMGRNRWLFIAAETALLAWAGLRYRLSTFRWFAAFLGVLLFCGNVWLLHSTAVVRLGSIFIPFSSIAVISATAALTFAAYLHKYKPLLDNAGPAERKFYFYLNWNMATFLAWLAPLALIGVSYDRIGRMADQLQTPVILYSWCALAAAVQAQSIALRSRFMQVMTVVVFAIAGIPALNSINFNWYTSLAAISLMFASAFVYKHYATRLKQVDSPVSFNALFLIAFFFAALLPRAAHMNGEYIIVWCSVQSLVVLLLGAKLPGYFLRMIAPVSFLLTAMSMIAYELSWPIIGVAVYALYAAWLVYYLPSWFELESGEDQFRHLYSITGAAVLAALLAGKMGPDWISFSWAVEAIVILLAGFALREKVMRFTALGLFCTLVLRMLSIEVYYDLDWIYVAPIVSFMYLAWARYKLPARFECDAAEKETRHVYSVLAAIVLTAFLGHKLGRTWVSCAWAVEGFLLLALGFSMREKMVRVTGLCVFAALVFRLFFIDLASAETIYRIFAFIVAGLVLLLSAYAYNWFSKRFGEDEISAGGNAGYLA